MVKDFKMNARKPIYTREKVSESFISVKDGAEKRAETRQR